MSECAERYEAYWQDADGTYEFIDLGSLGASSHGYCYRIFDLDRETLAHGYGVVDRWVPPGAETWTDIQAEVDAIDFPPEVPR